MEDPAGLIESLFIKAEKFGRTTYELSKLKMLAASTEVLTVLIAKMSVVIVIAMFAFVLSIGVAMLLGEMLGKLYYGFFVVAAFYMLAAIILHLFLRRWIKKPVSDLIIKQVLQ